MNRVLLASVLAGLCWSTPAVAAFYKCIVNGQPVYQATPCANGKGGAVTLKPITSLQGTGKAPKEPVPAAVAPAAPAAGTPAAPAVAPAAAGKSPANAPAARPDGSGYNSVGWKVGAPGYRMALAESKRTGAPVFVYFYTDWCGYCKRVQSTVFSDTEVAGRMRSFIKVKINPEKYPEDDALFRKLGGQAYPFALVGYDELTLEQFSFRDFSAAAARSTLDVFLKHR